jgi:hypothetical protein
MEKIITLTPDYLNTVDSIDKKIISDKMKGGPKATKIIMKDHDTGEILGEYHNKIVITGSILSAMNAFGINNQVMIPDYNRELSLDNTLDYSNTVPKNTPIVCLFCIGDSGCGTTPKDVFVADYIDRINPVNDIFPFRYVDKNADLSDDLRKYYFGRKTDNSKGKIAYYFKTFDTTPQLHLRYTDGTQINDEIYSIDTDQTAECYVETRLRITRTDFRDYFEQVLGWDKARISTLSLCYAWYDDTIDKYRWYQQIYPYSKLNFSFEWLVDLTKSIDFVYQTYY